MKTAIFWLSFLSLSVMAAPAVQRPHYFQQPDGTVFEGHLQGDEYLNWIETRAGEIVVFDAQAQQYEPAVIRSGTLVGNGKRYRTTANGRSTATESINASDVKMLWQSRRHAQMRRRSAVKN